MRTSHTHTHTLELSDAQPEAAAGESLPSGITRREWLGIWLAVLIGGLILLAHYSPLGKLNAAPGDQLGASHPTTTISQR